MARFSAVLVFSLLLAACGGVPVSVDWDQQYSFADIKSYGWIPNPKLDLPVPPVPSGPPGFGGGTSGMRDDLTDDRVTAAINSQMAARGLKRMEMPQVPDVLVSYHYGVADKLDIQSFHSHFGYYPCVHCSDISVRQYREGTLVIDIVDPKTRRMVWRGVSERRIPSFDSPEERRLYINETVAAIFEQFPPNLQQ